MNECFNCVHRGTVAGSAHSSCNALVESFGEKATAVGLLVTLGQAQIEVGGEPAIEFERRGIEMGWATWPINFDPVWLKYCKLKREK